MFMRIRKWLASPIFPGEEDKTTQASMLNRVGNYFVLLLLICQFIFVPFFSVRKLETSACILVMALVYALFRWFTFRGQIMIASRLLALAAWLMTLAITFLGGGLSSPFMISLLATTIIVSLLLDLRGGLIFTVFTVLIWFGFAVEQQSGPLVMHFFNYSPFTTWFFFSLILFFLQGLAYHSVQGLLHTIETSRRNEKAVRAAEETLRESGSRLRGLFQNAPIGMFHCLPEWRFLQVNPVLARMLGYASPEEFITDLNDLTHPLFVDPQQPPRITDLILRQDGWYSEELLLRCKDGRPLLVELRARRVLDSSGSLTYLEGFMEDISVRKQAEQILRETAERQTRILEACSNGVWDWDIPSGATTFSRGYLEPLGYEPGEFVQTFEEWQSTVHPDDLQRVIEAHDAACQPGRQLSVEFRMALKTGSWQWVLSRGVVVERDSQGLPLRMVGTHTDIQNLKAAEEALRESQATLYAVINSTPDLIWSVDVDTFGMQTFNQGLRDYFLTARGMDLSLGLTPEQLFPSQDYIQLWRAFYQRVLREGRFSAEYEVFSGTMFLELNFNLLTRDGAPFGISVFGRDISQFKQAAAALRESETRFRTITENSLTGIYIIQGGLLTYVNAALANLVGYHVDELIGLSPLAVIEPVDQPLVAENMRRRLAGETRSDHYEIRVRCKDGSIRICAILGTRAELNGQPAIIGTLLDFTERKRVEEAIQRRTAELGALNEIGQAFSKLADPSAILELIYNVIGRVFDNSNLYIALYDQDSQYISFPVYSMRGQRMDGGGRTLAEGLTDYIIRHNQPILIKTDMDASMQGMGIGLFGTPARSYMAAPINTEQRVLGVIALQDYERENVYDQHQLELLTTIAAQAAVALENARLFHAVGVSEARFRAVVDHNHDGIVMLDSDRKVLYSSPSYTRLSGYESAEWLGVAGSNYIHPDDQARVSAVFAELLQRPGGLAALEYRILHKDGHWLWVETAATNLLHEPEVGAVVLNSRDISERKRAEEALRESEERYRLLVDHSPNTVVVHSQGLVLFINPAGVQLLGGSSPDQFIGRNVLDFIAPEMHAIVRERLRAMREENIPVPVMENIYLRLDGQPVTVEAGAVPITYRGQPAVLSTITDISAHKHAEQALRESEERYRLLVDHSPNTIIVHVQGRIEFINQAGVNLLGGTSPHDFIGRDVYDFIHPDMWPKVRERMRAALEENKPAPPMENLYVRLDGQPVLVESAGVPFSLRGRQAVLSTIIDISERKRVQESLQRQNAHLQALQETALDLISQSDLPTLLENIVKRASQLVGTSSGYLDLAEPGTNRIMPTVGLGALTESLKFPIEHGEGTTGYVWRTGQPLAVADYDAWPGRVPGFARNLIRAIIAVPLRSGSEMLGVLGLAYGRETERSFGQEEIQLLSDFARLAVIAIQNARLFQQATQEIDERKKAEVGLEKRAAQLTLIKDMGQKIAGVLDPQGVLDLAARLVNEYFGYYHVALFTLQDGLEDQQRQMVMRARAGNFTHIFPVGHSIALGDGMVGTVAKTGHRILARNVHKERRYKNYYPEMINTQSELSLPLKVGRQVVGVLDVQSPELNAFGPDDLNVLQTLADEVAVALENARLYESVQTELAERKQIESELLQYRDRLEEMVQQRTHQLEIAMREAEEANRAKSDFLAVMSHEIRTPLNGVLGLTHLTLQTPLNEKQRDYLSRVQDSGEALLSIINDILDFSKIESGKLDLENVDFDLDEILHSLSNVLSFRAQEKDLELVYNTAPDLPRLLVGDPLRLRQILLNLAGNAVKFTQTGEVLLSISLGQSDQQHAVLDFSIRDTGIGMTPQQVQNLFQPFSQADASTSRRYGGTGLGLAISQRLVRMMGGDIQVQSEFGRGTVFSFSLPFARQPSRAEPFYAPVTELAGLRILVVDNHPSMRDFLKNSLESFSYRVTALSGVEAVLSLLKQPGPSPEFDLLLVDWNLPGEMRGLEAVRRMRAQPNLAKTHVIMLVSSQEMVHHAASDLDGYLLKPVTRSQLFDSVMNVFGVRANPALASGSPVLALDEQQALRGRRVLVVEDNRVNQIVAQDMLENMGMLVRLADSGEQAIQILADEEFDVILMDIQMPGMDGYQTTAQIRSDPRFASPRLPVIAMTAHALSSDRDKALQAGLDDYVSKPVDNLQLSRTLQRWLPPLAAAPGPEFDPQARINPGQPALANSLLKQGPGPGLPAHILVCLNTVPAINRLGGDLNLYRRILGIFRQEHAGMLDEIEQALQTGDLELARRQSHSLKGLSGTIGADAMMALAKQLEAAIAAGDQPHIQDYLTDLREHFSILLSALAELE